MSNDHDISNLSIDAGKGNPVILEKEEILSRKYFLKGRTIGISISESDNLAELGFGIAHLKDAVIEIARYIVVAGGTLAYGGDMRQGGFTELIFDLLAYYKADKALQPNERFYSYLAYPISTSLSSAKEAELRHNVSFKKITPPEDLNIVNPSEFLNPNSTENLYIWTRCLTKMREEMEADCDARIFIGGKTKGFKGKCPGILEELLIALEQKHPTYLIGAFGGITKDSIDALNGKKPESFSNNYYSDNHDYQVFCTLFNERHPTSLINYENYLSILQKIGMKEIIAHNGLSEVENFRLSITPHISEIVFLVMKGLTNTFAK
jgi:hypothetical protein